MLIRVEETPALWKQEVCRIAELRLSAVTTSRRNAAGGISTSASCSRRCAVADAVLWVSPVAVTSSCPTRSWLETPGRSPGPHLWRAGSWGLRVLQNPRSFPISAVRGCFHSSSLSPAALALVVIRGPASIGLLPDQLQASIPSARLALTRREFHPLNSHPFQAATKYYVVRVKIWRDGNSLPPIRTARFAVSRCSISPPRNWSRLMSVRTGP